MVKLNTNSTEIKAGLRHCSLEECSTCPLKDNMSCSHDLLIDTIQLITNIEEYTRDLKDMADVMPKCKSQETMYSIHNDLTQLLNGCRFVIGDDQK